MRMLRPELDDDDIIDDVSNFSVSFSIFCFSFITFDLELQIKSIKFVKNCKILNIEIRHIETIFGKNKFTKIPFWA